MNKIKAGLVTGAAGFLGFEHCKTLLNAGLGLIMIDINERLLKKKYKILIEKYKNVPIKFFVVDIGSERKMKKVIFKLNKENFFVRVLINNACIDPKPKKITKKNALIKTWDLELKVGLKGAYLAIELLSEKMKENKNGCIINMASDLSIIAPNQDIYKGIYKNFVKPVTYSVIKHGLVGMTKYYAANLAKYNITCNAISPVGVYDNQPQKFVKNLTNLIPMKRMATKNDINFLIQFLINDNQKFITGQNIAIDGGRTIL